MPTHMRYPRALLSALLLSSFGASTPAFASPGDNVIGRNDDLYLYPEYRCEGDDYLVGLAGRYDDKGFTGIRPICVRLEDGVGEWSGEPWTVGSPGVNGTAFRTVCPRDTVLAGISSFVQSRPHNLTVLCMHVVGEGASAQVDFPNASPVSVGSTFTGTYDQTTCDGIQRGGWGIYLMDERVERIEAIGLMCRSYPPDPIPATPAFQPGTP
jgi:hypothetical protein